MLQPITIKQQKCPKCNGEYAKPSKYFPILICEFCKEGVKDDYPNEEDGYFSLIGRFYLDKFK